MAGLFHFMARGPSFARMDENTAMYVKQCRTSATNTPMSMASMEHVSTKYEGMPMWQT